MNTILLVEDDPACASMLCTALTSFGHQVVHAPDGKQALQLFNPDAMNVAIVDLMMPEMDGPTLLRELRKRGIETKFVFVSGYPGEQFEQDLEGFTGYSFMPKPFSLKQLVEKVKDGLDTNGKATAACVDAVLNFARDLAKGVRSVSK